MPAAFVMHSEKYVPFPYKVPVFSPQRLIRKLLLQMSPAFAACVPCHKYLGVAPCNYMSVEGALLFLITCVCKADKSGAPQGPTD
eukprot:434194-Amphidinium_carterae.1